MTLGPVAGEPTVLTVDGSLAVQASIPDGVDVTGGVLEFGDVRDTDSFLVRADAVGAFQTEEVPRGTASLIARSWDDPSLVGFTTLDVTGQSVTAVTLHLGRGAEVHGRVTDSLLKEFTLAAEESVDLRELRPARGTVLALDVLVPPDYELERRSIRLIETSKRGWMDRTFDWTASASPASGAAPPSGSAANKGCRKAQRGAPLALCDSRDSVENTIPPT